LNYYLAKFTVQKETFSYIIANKIRIIVYTQLGPKMANAVTSGEKLPTSDGNAYM
jgi:hypothetical protein